MSDQLRVFFAAALSAEARACAAEAVERLRPAAPRRCAGCRPRTST